MAVLSTLQDFPFEECIQAVKDAERFDDFDAFYAHVVDSLPQNSPQTRKRYASLVMRWFFPDRLLNGLLPTAWQVYRDEQLLQELARVTILEVEPVIARFITKVVFPIPTGEPFPNTLARDYITDTFGAFKRQSYSRLLTSVRHLGFLKRNGTNWNIAAIATPMNGLLLLLHTRLAPTPRIVRVCDLFEQPCVSFLGFRDQEAVRRTLREAASAGLLARYSIVDELEQLTTRYAADEYIARKCRL
jgi:hypothetical protein